MGNCCEGSSNSQTGSNKQARYFDSSVQIPLPVTPVAPPPNITPPTRLIIKCVKALYDYDKRNDDDLDFQKGDILEVLEIDRDNPEWWLARKKHKTQEGYIPSNFVAEADETKVESYDWYFEVERRDAERLLHWAGNSVGTFLIRFASDKKTYALSVRDIDNSTNEVMIKHYRVRQLDNGQGVFIAARRQFKSLVQLVEHYSKSSDGLCCSLQKACPKEPDVIPFKDIEVEVKEVEIGERLGQGCFGEVFKGKFRHTVDVAVKCLKHGTMSSQAFLGEAKIMHRFRHKKLVQLMGVCSRKEPFLIITELMINGALLEYLRLVKSLPLKDIVDMSAQIAEGMKYLETKNFVHRDLRAANILVGNNNLVKVADFGLATLVNGDNTASKKDDAVKFPIKWTAPEAAYERLFSTKSDVWSFGILLYEMITFGRVPYPGMTGAEVLRRLEEGYRMLKPSGANFNCPDELYDIMLKCWDKIPDNRPTFEYLYHNFDNYATANESNYKEA